MVSRRLADASRARSLAAREIATQLIPQLPVAATADRCAVTRRLPRLPGLDNPDKEGSFMKRLAAVLVTAMACLAVFAQQALAVSPHLKGNHPLSFTDNGLTLTGTASYAGLGNFDTLQVLTARGNVTATCTNPAGATQPPGQNPAPVTLTGTTPISKADIKNGNVTITTTTAAPVSPIPGAPGCPNPNWTETITDVAFTSATIQVFQDSNANGMFEPSELVITVNVTFSPPTSNGPVPESGFTFTTSP
jgi:hypothetical protein